MTGNSAGQTGGGIYNDGTLGLVDSGVSGDTVTGGAGGGIFNSVFGTLTLTRVTISGNSADFGGGVASNGTLTIQDSAIVSNQASGDGGGLAIGSGTALVERATIASNSAGTNGGGVNYAGGLYTGGLPPVLRNVTIFDNGAGTLGGGIANTGYIGSMRLENATIAANRAAVSGAAIANVGYSGEVALSSSIVAASIGAPNCAGPITEGGYNLDDGSSCGVSSAAGSLAGADPRLDSNGLSHNGGPTPTIALEPDSPAVDAIPDAANGCGMTLTTDQRGTVRPQGNGCDIGAFELVPRTAIQQLDDLIALVNSYALDQLGTSLQDKLASARRFLLAGKPSQAAEKLAAFIAQVEAQRGKAITGEQADTLTSAARLLGDLIKT